MVIDFYNGTDIGRGPRYESFIRGAGFVQRKQTFIQRDLAAIQQTEQGFALPQPSRNLTIARESAEGNR